LKIADFGLAKKVKRSMISATGSGTLLYLAPEQAHGYPCFASDVFSLGLIAYQMLTAKLPRWPFEWPFDGYKTLKSKVPDAFSRFLRRATQYQHKHRFHDAMEMLEAFEKLLPDLGKFMDPPVRLRRRRKQRLGEWRNVRHREFLRAFKRRLFLRLECPECQGPISEHFKSCPWCGFEKICYREVTAFPESCQRCNHGIKSEWLYCPWCWGPGIAGADGIVRADPRYVNECRNCDKPLMDGMVYCPWCHAKRNSPVLIQELPHRCPNCQSSVAQDFWEHCPWCAKPLKKSATNK
jgi:hypothetical protein